MIIYKIFFIQKYFIYLAICITINIFMIIIIINIFVNYIIILIIWRNFIIISYRPKTKSIFTKCFLYTIFISIFNKNPIVNITLIIFYIYFIINTTISFSIILPINSIYFVDLIIINIYIVIINININIYIIISDFIIIRDSIIFLLIWISLFFFFIFI